MNKKIIYIILLIVILGGIIAFLVNQDKIEYASDTNTNTNTPEITSRGTEEEKEVASNNQTDNNNETKETIITELEDGTLYSLSNEEIKADIVVGDNYFDTQITDMMTNPDSYKDKVIEIEGMFLESYPDPYTFVARYATSSLCPYCAPGYSYMEYQWHGENIDLKDTDSWIKVKGKLEVGNDETSNNTDYYYINAESIEVMKERGKEEVTN